MRYAVVAVSAALLVSLFSACAPTDTGSSGLSCEGDAEAPKRLEFTPVTSDLPLTGGEGSYFCTVPGTPSTFTMLTTSANFNSGQLALSPDATCDSEVIVDFSYGYIFQLRAPSSPFFNFPAGPKGTFSLYEEDLDNPATTSQFCWNSDEGGYYKFFGPNGNTQTGTFQASP